MVPFSYTVSPFLKSELNTIDAKRATILLTPLSPSDELKIKWEATVNRIFYSLRLKNIHHKKSLIAQLLSPQGKKKLSSEEQNVLTYKKTQDYIYQNWLVSDEPVKSETILHLLNFFSSERIKIDREELDKNLHFIQASSEHPIIQAGLAQILVLTLSALTPSTEQLSRFISFLFLAKRGYDFRGFLVLEDYFAHNLASYQQALENNLRASNLSGFLEYFTEAVKIQSEEILGKLSGKGLEMIYPDSYFSLTERQKRILAFFDEPGVRVTNRTLQKAFSISQITASRDLAKLASLSLIFPAGKGRSVYYTKV